MPFTFVGKNEDATSWIGKQKQGSAGYLKKCIFVSVIALGEDRGQQGTGEAEVWKQNSQLMA